MALASASASKWPWPLHRNALHGLALGFGFNISLVDLQKIGPLATLSGVEVAVTVPFAFDFGS